jgi:hypothetical protein
MANFKGKMICEISGFHGSVAEDSSLLGCDAVLQGATEDLNP